MFRIKLTGNGEKDVYYIETKAPQEEQEWIISVIVYTNWICIIAKITNTECLNIIELLVQKETLFKYDTKTGRNHIHEWDGIEKFKLISIKSQCNGTKFICRDILHKIYIRYYKFINILQWANSASRKNNSNTNARRSQTIQQLNGGMKMFSMEFSFHFQLLLLPR